MKVLYFHQHFSTPKGSTGNRSYWMAKYLVERGHSVHVVCGSFGQGKTGLTGKFRHGRRSGMVDGIKITEFQLAYSNSDGFLVRSLTFLRFSMRSTWLALRQDFDVLFATSTPLTAGIPGIFARVFRRKPFVFEVRDLWPELPRAMGVIRNRLVLGLMSVLEITTYRAAHRLIALAPGIRDGIMARGIPEDRVTMIPNGCDIELFSRRGESEPDAARTQDDFVVIYSGTHGIANGLDSVLDVAAELQRRQRTDIRFLLVGDGMTKQALRTRAERENLTNVEFKPPVSKDRLALLLSEADLGMQILANVPAFYYGTSPNKFFDYIAAGMPVICNYPGWIGDLIDEYNCGYVVPPESPSVFADTLILAADRREGLLEMGRNSRALAEDRFARGRLATKFCDWLEAAAK